MVTFTSGNEIRKVLKADWHALKPYDNLRWSDSGRDGRGNGP